MRLTGKTRYRLGWRGKVVVQAEFWRVSRIGGYERAWQDADFRALLDIADGEIHPDSPSRMPPPPPRPGEKR